MGSTIAAGVSTPTPWGGQCEIVGGFILLDLLIGPAHKGGPAGYNEYLADAQNGKANDPRMYLEILGGIGDGAFVDGGGPLASCVFYTGDTTVTITVRTGGNAGPPPIEQVTAIVTMAAAHLVK